MRGTLGWRSTWMAGLVLSLAACQTVPPPTPRPIAAADRQCTSAIRYPVDARRQERAGLVVMQARVELDGSLSEVRVTRSSGMASLDAEALRYVRLCRFPPVTQGNYIPALVQQSVNFRLE